MTVVEAVQTMTVDQLGEMIVAALIGVGIASLIASLASLALLNWIGRKFK